MSGAIEPLSKDTRDAIGRTVGSLRSLFEDDFAAQAAGRFGLHATPREGEGDPLAPWVEPVEALSLSPTQVDQREELIAALRHLVAGGSDGGEAVRRLVREAAFTAVNRLLTVRVAEALGLLPEVLTSGRVSAAYREIVDDLFPLLAADADAGFWTVVQVCGDELGAAMPLLFDRRLPTAAFFPRRTTVDAALETINATEVAGAWTEPEALGWAYQFFNREDERKEMRGGAPRDSRELAVRNQFFTPRYVVDWLVQNTLGRRLRQADHAVELPLLEGKSGEHAPLALEEVRILDPAVGSGHFLLGCYDLLEEAWRSVGLSPADAAPLILQSLFGVDVDARASQVAQAVLLLRAARAAPRARLEPPAIVTARPLPGDPDVRAAVFSSLSADARDLANELEMALAAAPVLGTLLKVEHVLGSGAARAVARPRLAAVATTLESLDRELMEALNEVAQSADASAAERMFAADGRDAIGFVEACRRRYDVVLMNPPFGEPVAGTEAYLNATYSASGFDLYAAFVDRGLGMLRPGGHLGAITSRTGFFLTRFTTWRTNVLPRLRAFVDLGVGVMHKAMVEAASYVVSAAASSAPAVFRRLLEVDDKGPAVECRAGPTFERAPADFLAIPGAPAAYWLDPDLLEVFESHHSIADASHVDARVGASTGDNFRYLRCWWEVPRSGPIGDSPRWVSFAKGGEYAPYYSHIHLVVDWDYTAGTFRGFQGRRGRASPIPENREHFGRPGLTWSVRSQKGFSVRPLPRGCIFGHKGPIVFVGSDRADDLDRTMAFLNSSAAAALLEAMVAFGSYEVGAVQRLPALDPGDTAADLAAELSRARMGAAVRTETDHLFVSPWAPAGPAQEEVVERSRRVDEAVSAALGRSETAAPLAATFPSRWFDEELRDPASPTPHQEVSYLVGVAFGRWDPRYAAGVAEPPPAHGPYDPLPAAPRGALQDAHPTDGLLHDEPGHERDVVGAVERALDEIEAGPAPPVVALRNASLDLRRHLRTRFADDHLRDYSASRRNAPIYWHLAVPSREWGLWIYAPRLDREMVFAIVRAANDRLRRLSQQLERVGDEHARGDRAAIARREGLESLTAEVVAFSDAAQRVARSGWTPDLNDGLVLCAAPLEALLAPDRWRGIVAEQRAKLESGAYSWSATQRDFFGGGE